MSHARGYPTCPMYCSSLYEKSWITYIWSWTCNLRSGDLVTTISSHQPNDGNGGTLPAFQPHGVTNFVIAFEFFPHLLVGICPAEWPCELCFCSITLRFVHLLIFWKTHQFWSLSFSRGTSLQWWLYWNVTMQSLCMVLCACIIETSGKSCPRIFTFAAYHQNFKM